MGGTRLTWGPHRPRFACGIPSCISYATSERRANYPGVAPASLPRSCCRCGQQIRILKVGIVDAWEPLCCIPKLEISRRRSCGIVRPACLAIRTPGVAILTARLAIRTAAPLFRPPPPLNVSDCVGISVRAYECV